jgi:hypothetical protein
MQYSRSRMKRSLGTGSRAKARYPLGTIATYGPDNTLATKLVASVLEALVNEKVKTGLYQTAS